MRIARPNRFVLLLLLLLLLMSLVVVCLAWRANMHHGRWWRSVQMESELEPIEKETMVGFGVRRRLGPW